MLSEIAIIEINDLLTLCDSYRMSQSEIDQLNALNYDPLIECDYYTTAQDVLTNRSKTDISQNLSLEELLIFATNAGCDIELKEEIVPVVYIPVLGGSIE